ncbi:MAG: hypothetical protein M3R17_09265 [Bacteroidota bacterium]|nr:hypothetical protein [Bacteroidota bacterium]
MNKFISALLICAVLSGCGQSQPEPKPQSESEKNDISSIKSARHINIPGTRLFIIPPPGFNPASAFVGLQKDEYTACQIMDNVGGNFYSNAATFDRQAFEKQGAKVFDYKELKVNGFPGKYIFLQGDPAAKGISLIFGDSTFSIMLMFIYPAANDKTGKEIQAAIKTVYYDKELTVNPFAGASFTIDDSKSKFRFSKSTGGLFIYSPGGSKSQLENDSPFITVMSLPKDQTMNAQSIRDILVVKLMQYGMQEEKRSTNTLTTYNGYSAYETEISGTMKDEKSLIYILVVLKGEKAVVFQAVFNKDFDSNLAEAKKLCYEIKFK